MVTKVVKEKAEDAKLRCTVVTVIKPLSLVITICLVFRAVVKTDTC